MADDTGRCRLVQQYVERQKAYLPLYSNHDLVNECHPAPPRTDIAFGFDTPVLRPRAPRAPSADLAKQHPKEALPPSSAPAKKDKPRRKSTTISVHTDSERAARLADRRERKRKKRAIVNPSQKDVEESTAPKKGRTKKPAALALLYGFSAANVTKDRLTLTPAPSLGVFSKGKASVKKKVSTAKKSSSRNELFSEFAFLNKSSEQAVDDITDDGLSSSNPAPKKIRDTNGTRRNRSKSTRPPALKVSASQALPCTTAESEVWDIEAQSKLPSSACDVPNEPEAKSASVVFDLHKTKWFTSADAPKEHQEETRTPTFTVTRRRSQECSMIDGSLPVRSDLRADVADVSSLHPSHSASQVGRRAAEIQPSEYFSERKSATVRQSSPRARSNARIEVLCSAPDPRDSGPRLEASRYFAEAKPASVREFAIDPPQRSRSNDGINVLGSQDQTDGPKMYRVASPIDSLIGNPLVAVAFQTPYGTVAPLEFPSDDYWGDVDVPSEYAGELDHGYSQSSAVETRDDRFITESEYEHAYQNESWDWCPPADFATDVLGCDAGSDPLEQEYEEGLKQEGFALEPYPFEVAHEYDTEEEVDKFSVYEDGSICDGEENLDDVADFLEGRALLLGMPVQHSERARREGVSGLVRAEMDVASRLRDHWRPLRF